MSMRPKSDRGKLEPLPDPFEFKPEPGWNHEGDASKAWAPGTQGAKDDLLAYLTAYLGDAVFARRFADCIDLIRAKNADYTQGTAKSDRIAAFRRISKDIGVSMEKVWGVFFGKHLSAIQKYIKDGQLESEPIDGRIADAINYLVLLDAIIKDEA